jgi:ABC-type sugar transport system ATPase subunit
MGVVLSGLKKRYGDGTDAVSDLNVDITTGEFFALLGPSGCGKTTTLRMIAGLEEPTAGTIHINGRDVTGLDPGDRDVAMVFQSYALYPHMTARQNLTLNLQAQKVARHEIETRVSEVARLLGIEKLLQKKPGQLSGGQRQRVALGRAIIRRPAVFLMDEPLSSLDLKLREQMRTELKRLHQKLGITTVYVTHDQIEALTLSERIAVMLAGEVQQIGSPTEVYERPANLFVAQFIGSPGINLLNATSDEGGLRIGPWSLPEVQVIPPREIVIGIRPEDILLVEPTATTLCGLVELLEPVGSTILVFVRLEKCEGIVQGSGRIVVGLNARHPIAVGERVGLNLRTEGICMFDPAGPALRQNEWTIREHR